MPPMTDEEFKRRVVCKVGPVSLTAETFQIVTGDPRFDPKAAVKINGYLFIPARLELEGENP